MEYQFNETNNDDRNSDFEGEPTSFGMKAIGYSLLAVLAACAAWACVKAAAAIAVLIGRGVIVASIGAAAITALLSMVSIIGEHFNKEKF